MHLTKEQIAIIEHDKGHARVRAVAGSGKTTTMVERIVHLLEHGTDPAHIMVLMFNKSARDAFSHSLTKKLKGSKLKAPQIRTFHALGLRLTDSFIRRGSIANFRLVTEESARENIARKVLQYLAKEVDDALDIKDDLEDFLSFIDLVKAYMQRPSEVAREIKLKDNVSSFIEGYDLFEEARQNQKIRFYSDIIADPLIAMESDEELLNWVANRVDHIIVDEYQDINESQQQLLKIVAGKRAQLMVVGDGDQCIYEWRGAKPDYITSRFGDDFKNPKEYSLSLTFRYGHSLSLAANYLISNNKDADRSICISHQNNTATKLNMQHVVAGKTHPIIEIAKDWLAKDRLLNEMAVLVRLYAMSVPIELAMLEAGIPYVMLGGRTVFNCPEIIALTGYLRLCDASLGINYDIAISHITEMLMQPHIGIKRARLEPLADAMAKNPHLAPSLIQDLITSETPLYRKKRLQKYADSWQWLIEEGPEAKAAKVLRRLVARLELYNFYQDFSTRQSAAENRIQTCEALISFAEERNLNVAEFVQELSRLQQQEGDGSGLLITSIHRAKGLEWPTVILPGLAEGRFPFSRSNDEKDLQVGEGVEDERRLFYVGMTRGIEEVYFLHPIDPNLQDSLANGRASCLKEGEASCFLYEANIELASKVGSLIYGAKKCDEISAIDASMANHYLENIGGDHAPIIEKTETIKGKKLQAVEEAALGTKKNQRLRGVDVQKGMSVYHDRFGEGTVTAVDDRKLGKIRVDFAKHGNTVLLLSYAKLYSA